MGKKLTILITHFNNANGLHKTVHSINEAIFPDLVIVDDGSDQTPKIEEFDYYQGHVKILNSPQNEGIEAALNKGIEYIIASNKYDYVARLDCGDVCAPNRFKIQAEYLDANPEIHLVGSHVDFVSEEGQYLYTYKVPTEHKDIRKKMFVKNCFIHPAVVYRIEALKAVGAYPTQFKYAEDYAYFFEIMKKFQTANIDQVLTSCQSDEGGISSSNRRSQLKSRIAVIRAYALPSIHYVHGLVRTSLLFLIPDSLNKNLKTLYYR